MSVLWCLCHPWVLYHSRISAYSPGVCWLSPLDKTLSLPYPGSVMVLLGGRSCPRSGREWNPIDRPLLTPTNSAHPFRLHAHCLYPQGALVASWVHCGVLSSMKSFLYLFRLSDLWFLILNLKSRCYHFYFALKRYFQVSSSPSHRYPPFPPHSFQTGFWEVPTFIQNLWFTHPKNICLLGNSVRHQVHYWPLLAIF